jgi:glycosyltransferase involved in cell wall biosynthesis
MKVNWGETACSPGMTHPESSTTHLVLIPTYNAGAKVLETVQSALQHWAPVWVVVDGSTDGTGDQLCHMALGEPQLKVMVLEKNQGKGAAVMHGLEQAQAAGFTHALTMDSDGQHPAHLISAFMQASQAHPAHMILGKPVFDASAPALRVQGRKVSNALANLETLWMGIGDSLFGFRVYPVAPLLQIMRRLPWMRRFDFDIEAAVRLCWAGVWPINIDAPVKYLTPDDGGVSHFNYWRDNKLLAWMHLRLVLGFLLRLPLFLIRRLGSSALAR